MLNCAETVTLILGGYRPLKIQNSDVLLYSFPHLYKYILLKLNILEEGEVFDAEEVLEEKEQEETKDIISKEQEFFCVKNNYLELYFIRIEKDDSKAQDLL